MFYTLFESLGIEYKMFDRLWSRGNNLRATRVATVYLFRIFKIIDLLGSKQWKPLYYLFAILINLMVCVFIPISFVLSVFYESSKMSTSQLLTSFQVAIDVWGVPAKTITLIVSLKHLQRCLHIMDILDSRCQHQEEHDKIWHCCIVGNRLTLFYVSFYFLYSTVATLTSMIMGQPPYSLFMPMIDWRNSSAEFAAQTFLEYLAICLICVYQAGADVYSVIYIYIIRIHMQVLVQRVRRLGTECETYNDGHFEQLVMCVKDHQHLLRLLKIISPVISITIFVQFIITAAILGITLINIFIFADTSTQIASVVYFMAVLFQTAPCCYQATCLLKDSDQLSLAIFHCEWFDKDIRFRKMMIFFMMRSQMPMTLTALKLFPITLNTSLRIAKFSFSLYTLIKKFDFGQQLKD